MRTSHVRRALEQLEQAGTTHRGPSGRRDRLGRPISDKVWNLASQAGLWPVPNSGPTGTNQTSGHRGFPGWGEDPRRGSPRGRATGRPSEQEQLMTVIGDELYPAVLADAVRDGHVTNAEAEERYALHKLIAEVAEFPPQEASS